MKHQRKLEEEKKKEENMNPIEKKAKDFIKSMIKLYKDKKVDENKKTT